MNDANKKPVFQNGGLRLPLPAKTGSKFKDKTKYTRKKKHK